jgi:hypothetical protein
MASASSGADPTPKPGLYLDFDPKPRVLRVSLVGAVTDGTLTMADAAVRRFLSDEGATYGIFDYSAVTELDVTANYVRSIADNSPAVPPMKLRIAVAPQTVIYGMNRMYGLLIEGKRSDFEIVRTMGQAEALIGLGKLDFSRRL